MDDAAPYTPPRVWHWDSKNGGTWDSINRPIAGPTHERPLPVGQHPIQLYSLATPNGVKITVLLEELLILGFDSAEYDAHLIRIIDGEQFGSGFVEMNPNSKIPAVMDHSTEPPTRIFESGAILLYFAEKFGALLPDDQSERAECLSWLFWQIGSTPYLGGGFGHFYKYAPVKLKYCIDRYTMELKRQLDVIDRHLADKQFLCPSGYSIADIAIWPWYGAIVLNQVYDAAEFLNAESYTHLNRWAREIEVRPAVQRGKIVNKTWGPLNEQLHERHDAADFENATQDKVEVRESQ